MHFNKRILTNAFTEKIITVELQESDELTHCGGRWPSSGLKGLKPGTFGRGQGHNPVSAETEQNNSKREMFKASAMQRA